MFRRRRGPCFRRRRCPCCFRRRRCPCCFRRRRCPCCHRRRRGPCFRRRRCPCCFRRRCPCCFRRRCPCCFRPSWTLLPPYRTLDSSWRANWLIKVPRNREKVYMLRSPLDLMGMGRQIKFGAWSKCLPDNMAPSHLHLKRPRNEDSKNGLRFALRRLEAEIIDILGSGPIWRVCLAVHSTLQRFLKKKACVNASIGKRYNKNKPSKVYLPEIKIEEKSNMTSSRFGSAPATEEFCLTSGIPPSSPDLPVELHEKYPHAQSRAYEMHGTAYISYHYSCRCLFFIDCGAKFKIIYSVVVRMYSSTYSSTLLRK